MGPPPGHRLPRDPDRRNRRDRHSHCDRNRLGDGPGHLRRQPGNPATRQPRLSSGATWASSSWDSTWPSHWRPTPLSRRSGRPRTGMAPRYPRRKPSWPTRPPETATGAWRSSGPWPQRSSSQRRRFSCSGSRDGDEPVSQEARPGERLETKRRRDRLAGIPTATTMEAATDPGCLTTITINSRDDFPGDSGVNPRRATPERPASGRAVSPGTSRPKVSGDG